MSIKSIVKTENRDTTPMNEQKARFEDFIKYYARDNGAMVSIAIGVLDYLTDKTNEAHIKVLAESSPAFYNITIVSLWEFAVIELDKMLTKKSRVSVWKLISYVKANRQQIFTGEFYDEIRNGNTSEIVKVTFPDFNEEIAELENQLNEKTEIIATIKTYRNKRFAHFDKQKIEVGISVDLLKEVWDTIMDVISRLNVLYCRKAIAANPINYQDVKSLICNLEERKRLRKMFYARVKTSGEKQ